MAKVLLNNEQHKGVKFAPEIDLDALSKEYLVAISVNEFVAVSAEHPIVFIKHSETGAFHAAALLGLQPDENLYCDDKKWLGSYVPQSIRYAPFSLAQTRADDDQLYLAVDTDSPLFNPQVGEALFDQSGIETQALNKLTQALVQRSEFMAFTHKFTQSLADQELLIEKNLQIKTKDEPDRNLTGIYVINEQKLNELSDSQFCELRKQGALPAIYAQICSTQQIPKLVERRANKA